MLFIGVDPGVGGGIAVLDGGGNVISATKMPATDRDVLDVFEAAGPYPASAVLERVSSSPQMGVVSAFTFGKGYGALRMALCAAGVAYNEVSPAVWQKAMGCRTKGDKNVTKRRAQEIFPRVKVTHALADALLLAEYCRRVSRNLVYTTPATGPVLHEESIE